MFCDLKKEERTKIGRKKGKKGKKRKQKEKKRKKRTKSHRGQKWVGLDERVS